MDHSVCLWGYEISDHTQVKLVPYARLAALKCFANKIGPDQAALLRAAWSWSILFAYGDMIYLIIYKSI